jgi:hypothetical protein
VLLNEDRPERYTANRTVARGVPAPGVAHLLTLGLSTLRPPVVAFDEKRFSFDTGGFVDRVTGGLVMIWSVSHVEIHGDAAVCDVAWQSGNRAAGRHAVYLRKRGNWMAEREEALWITQTPNKAPEPTSGSVTPRAIVRTIELNQRSQIRDAARGAPAPLVAHL